MQRSRNQRTQGNDNIAVKKLKKLVDDSLGAGFLFNFSCSKRVESSPNV